MIFYLKDFVGGMGIMLSLGSFVLHTFFETMPREAKKHEEEEISRSKLSTFTSALDSLVVEVSESRPFYSNFV